MGPARSGLMTQLALADYLTDFGAGIIPAAIVEIVVPAAPSAAVVELAPPPPDIDSLVAAEVALVEARLRAEMSDAAEAALSVERARHELQIAEMQIAFGAEAGARIVDAVEAAEARLAAFAAS